jgi:hypothetical protein
VCDVLLTSGSDSGAAMHQGMLLQGMSTLRASFDEGGTEGGGGSPPTSDGSTSEHDEFGGFGDSFGLAFCGGGGDGAPDAERWADDDDIQE